MPAGEQTTVHPYNGILLAIKRNKPLTQINFDDALQHYGEASLKSGHSVSFDVKRQCNGDEQIMDQQRWGMAGGNGEKGKA